MKSVEKNKKKYYEEYYSMDIKYFRDLRVGWKESDKIEKKYYEKDKELLKKHKKKYYMENFEKTNKGLKYKLITIDGEKFYSSTSPEELKPLIEKMIKLRYIKKELRNRKKEILKIKKEVYGG